MALNLTERAPKFIQNISLWSDFLDVVTTELNRLKTEMTKQYYKFMTKQPVIS